MSGKICKKCGEKFIFTLDDKDFIKEVSPIINGITYNFVVPEICPRCKEMHRLAFRNERQLYKRKCDITGENIISIYSPDKKYKVVSSDYWWSDKWDALIFGKDFDFEKSFFKQFGELKENVPVASLFGSQNENVMSNFTDSSENVYLSTGIYECKNTYYTGLSAHCNNTLDCYDCGDMEFCYRCIKSANCINCTFVDNSKECNDCHYLFSCDGLDNCLFSVSQSNKKYLILNKQYTKQEYEKIEEKINNNLEIKQEYIAKYKDLLNKTPRRNSYFLQCENVSGDDIMFSKNIENGITVKHSENCKNCYVLFGVKNCREINNMEIDSQYLYDCIGCGTLYKGAFNITCRGSKNLYYSESCYNCENCFGCTGLRDKKYCILNKQYTKQEYEEKLLEIIKYMTLKTQEWGKFFPAELSYFGYNESAAQELYPLSKEKIQEKGFKYSNYERPIPKVEKIIEAKDLPNDINKITDSILKRAIKCERTGKLFRIIKEELDFYRKMSISIPRLHPDARFNDILKDANPRKFYDRKCAKCNKEIKSMYAPNREETIYCEECYNKTTYS
ncbi:MAG: hypothetical protein N4A38_00450 [Candidatus Gracilibacteria bacterium]|nr:hypothetical protein [Candidatus Gracilibacteria bacterium]